MRGCLFFVLDFATAAEIGLHLPWSKLAQVSVDGDGRAAVRHTPNAGSLIEVSTQRSSGARLARRETNLPVNGEDTDSDGRSTSWTPDRDVSKGPAKGVRNTQNGRATTLEREARETRRHQRALFFGSFMLWTIVVVICYKLHCNNEEAGIPSKVGVGSLLCCFFCCVCHVLCWPIDQDVEEYKRMHEEGQPGEGDTAAGDKVDKDAACEEGDAGKNVTDQAREEATTRKSDEDEAAKKKAEDDEKKKAEDDEAAKKKSEASEAAL
jgi:hypothetical protein